MLSVSLLTMSVGIRNFVGILPPSSMFILLAAFAATALVVRWRGSTPARAPSASVGVDFMAPVMPLRISPLILSSQDFALDDSNLMHQIIAA